MSDRDIRQNIVAAATRLFAERGYGSTSVRELAQAAGVTKPTLYYHFGSKEDLFHELVRFHLDRFTQQVDQARNTAGTVRERLERFVSTTLDGARSQPEAVRFLMLLRPVGDNPDYPAVDTFSVHKGNLMSLVELVEEGQRNGELRADVCAMDCALALLGVVNLRVLAAVTGMPVSGDEAHRTLDIFFSGVESR